MIRHAKYLSLAATALALTACGKPTDGASSGANSSGAAPSCLSRAYPNIGGPIDLIDHTGTQVTEETYKGRTSILYFGFTYCPDVCPLTLIRLKQAYTALPEGMDAPQTLLVSVDPDRDTPEKLAAYISSDAFPEQLSGLTGSSDQVRAAADAFIADFSKVEDPESSAEYTMDHTTLLYVMDEDWKLKTFFTHEDTPEDISACLTALFNE
ncbi:MAG: SCO family protein [Hyphomonas sp.]